MTDRLTELFDVQAQLIQVPLPDVTSTIGRGRRLAVRRGAGAALMGVVVLAAITIAIPRLDFVKDAAPLLPVDRGGPEVKDQTVLTLLVEGDEQASESPLLTVILKPSPMLCWRLPRWVETATIYDASDEALAAYPAEMGIRRSDDGTGSSCGPGEESQLAELAQHPEVHRVEIRGDGRTLDASLTVMISRDFSEEALDETTLLEYKASEAINQGDLERAEELGRQRLEGAPSEDHWDYGNAMHYGHLILGHVALRQDDVRRAKRELLLAGRTSGSPQLDSFGPNMSLARDLLAVGEDDVVLKYLDLVQAFWDFDEDVQEWARQIRSGEIPDFGANLLYGSLQPDPIMEN